MKNPSIFPSVESKYKERNSVRKVLFITILVIFAIFATIYSLYTPTFEGPDERRHYSSILYESPSSIFDESIERDGLYYWTSSIFLPLIHPPELIEINPNYGYPQTDLNKFFHSTEEIFPFKGTALAVHTLRVFSIICGIFTLIFTYKIARQIFPSNTYLPLFVMTNVALIPRFTWMSAVLNDDVLIWTLATASIFFLIKFVNNTEKLRYLILTGIFIGLSVIAKSNGVILYAVIIITFIFLLSKKQITKKIFCKDLVIFGLVSIASGTWIYITRIILRVIQSNPGINHTYDLLLSSNSEFVDVSSNDMVNRIFNFGEIDYRFWEYNWNHFGANVISTPNFYEYLADILLVLSLIGLVLIFTKKIKLSEIKIQQSHLVILASTSAFMLFGMISFYLYSGNSVSRNTYPAISCFSILFSLGLYAFLHKKKLRVILFLPLLFLIILDLNLLQVMQIEFADGIGSIPNQTECYNLPVNYDEISWLMHTYCTSKDLKETFPKIANGGDLQELIEWAYNTGYKEKPELSSYRPFYEMMKIYYEDESLKNKFPDAKNAQHVEGLTNWMIKEGITKYPSTKENLGYYLLLKNRPPPVCC